MDNSCKIIFLAQGILVYIHPINLGDVVVSQVSTFFLAKTGQLSC